MFWKSKEEREQERIQREKDEEEQISRQVRWEKEKKEESDFLAELINVPSRVGRYVIEVLSDEAAESGHAFSESAGQVFFLDFVNIVLAFGRAEGGLSYEMVQLLLEVGSGEVRQDNRSPTRISDAMYALQQTMKSSGVSHEAQTIIEESFADMLQGDKELIVVPRTVSALELYDEKHGTEYATETSKVFLKLVAKLAKGSDSLRYANSDFARGIVQYQELNLKPHLFVEGQFREILGKVSSHLDGDLPADANDGAGCKTTDCAECRSSYLALGIEDGASEEETKRAYRDLCKVWHPDRFSGEGDRLRKKAEEEFKKVQSAYNHLGEHCRLNSDLA